MNDNNKKPTKVIRLIDYREPVEIAELRYRAKLQAHACEYLEIGRKLQEEFKLKYGRYF